MSTEKIERNGNRTQTKSGKLNGVFRHCRVIRTLSVAHEFIIMIIIIIIINLFIIGFCFFISACEHKACRKKIVRYLENCWLRWIPRRGFLKVLKNDSALPLWMAIDNLWKRYIVSFGSSVASVTRLSISSITSKACMSHEPAVSIAMA